MKLGRVAGNVVASVHHPFFDGRTLLLVDLLDPLEEGSGPTGYVIAVDTVGAGAGETVLVLDEGNSARQVLGAPPESPIRALVVGVVDAVEVEERP